MEVCEWRKAELQEIAAKLKNVAGVTITAKLGCLAFTIIHTPQGTNQKQLIHVLLGFGMEDQGTTITWYADTEKSPKFVKEIADEEQFPTFGQLIQLGFDIRDPYFKDVWDQVYRAVTGAPPEMEDIPGIELYDEALLARHDPTIAERLVTAAVSLSDGKIFSNFCHTAIYDDIIGEKIRVNGKQLEGYLTNKGRFLTRLEAYRFLGHTDEPGADDIDSTIYEALANAVLTESEDFTPVAKNWDAAVAWVTEHSQSFVEVTIGGAKLKNIQSGMDKPHPDAMTMDITICSLPHLSLFLFRPSWNKPPTFHMKVNWLPSTKVQLANPHKSRYQIDTILTNDITDWDSFHKHLYQQEVSRGPWLGSLTAHENTLRTWKNISKHPGYALLKQTVDTILSLFHRPPEIEDMPEIERYDESIQFSDFYVGAKVKNTIIPQVGTGVVTKITPRRTVWITWEHGMTDSKPQQQGYAFEFEKHGDNPAKNLEIVVPEMEDIPNIERYDEALISENYEPLIVLPNRVRDVSDFVKSGGGYVSRTNTGGVYIEATFESRIQDNTGAPRHIYIYFIFEENSTRLEMSITQPDRKSRMTTDKKTGATTISGSEQRRVDINDYIGTDIHTFEEWEKSYIAQGNGTAKDKRVIQRLHKQEPEFEKIRSFFNEVMSIINPGVPEMEDMPGIERYDESVVDEIEIEEVRTAKKPAETVDLRSEIGGNLFDWNDRTDLELIAMKRAEIHAARLKATGWWTRTGAFGKVRMLIADKEWLWDYKGNEIDQETSARTDSADYQLRIEFQSRSDHNSRKYIGTLLEVKISLWAPNKNASNTSGNIWHRKKIYFQTSSVPLRWPGLTTIPASVRSDWRIKVSDLCAEAWNNFMNEVVPDVPEMEDMPDIDRYDESADLEFSTDSVSERMFQLMENNGFSHSKDWLATTLEGFNSAGRYLKGLEDSGVVDTVIFEPWLPQHSSLNALDVYIKSELVPGYLIVLHWYCGKEQTRFEIEIPTSKGKKGVNTCTFSYRIGFKESTLEEFFHACMVTVTQPKRINASKKFWEEEPVRGRVEGVYSEVVNRLFRVPAMEDMPEIDRYDESIEEVFKADQQMVRDTSSVMANENNDDIRAHVPQYRDMGFRIVENDWRRLAFIWESQPLFQEGNTKLTLCFNFYFTRQVELPGVIPCFMIETGLEFHERWQQLGTKAYSLKNAPSHIPDELSPNHPEWVGIFDAQYQRMLSVFKVPEMEEMPDIEKYDEAVKSYAMLQAEQRWGAALAYAKKVPGVTKAVIDFVDCPKTSGNAHDWLQVNFMQNPDPDTTMFGEGWNGNFKISHEHASKPGSVLNEPWRAYLTIKDPLIPGLQNSFITWTNKNGDTLSGLIAKLEQEKHPETVAEIKKFFSGEGKHIGEMIENVIQLTFSAPEMEDMPDIDRYDESLIQKMEEDTALSGSLEKVVSWLSANRRKLKLKIDIQKYDGVHRVDIEFAKNLALLLTETESGISVGFTFPTPIATQPTDSTWVKVSEMNFDQFLAAAAEREQEAGTSKWHKKAGRVYKTLKNFSTIVPQYELVKNVFNTVMGILFSPPEMEDMPDIERYDESITEGRPFKKTVKAYKLFRTKKGQPGKIFPLFVSRNDDVPIGVWVRAKAGPAGKTAGRVKSSLGDLAFRPGFHAGDVPVALHIGGKSMPGLIKPDIRPDDQVWAEVEFPADVDWQTRANDNAVMTKAGKPNMATAHITDQVPFGGYYRYKTNASMSGNWLISGDMKVNRILSNDEVKTINAKAGVADLPRKEDLVNRLPESLENGIPLTYDQWCKLEPGDEVYIKDRRGQLTDKWIIDQESDPTDNASRKFTGKPSFYGHIEGEHSKWRLDYSSATGDTYYFSAPEMEDMPGIERYDESLLSENNVLFKITPEFTQRMDALFTKHGFGNNSYEPAATRFKLEYWKDFECKKPKDSWPKRISIRVTFGRNKNEIQIGLEGLGKNGSFWCETDGGALWGKTYDLQRIDDLNYVWNLCKTEQVSSTINFVKLCYSLSKYYKVFFEGLKKEYSAVMGDMLNELIPVPSMEDIPDIERYDESLIQQMEAVTDILTARQEDIVVAVKWVFAQPELKVIVPSRLSAAVSKWRLIKIRWSRSLIKDADLDLTWRLFPDERGEGMVECMIEIDRGLHKKTGVGLTTDVNIYGLTGHESTFEGFLQACINKSKTKVWKRALESVRKEAQYAEISKVYAEVFKRIFHNVPEMEDMPDIDRYDESVSHISTEDVYNDPDILADAEKRWKEKGSEYAVDVTPESILITPIYVFKHDRKEFTVEPKERTARIGAWLGSSGERDWMALYLPDNWMELQDTDPSFDVLAKEWRRTFNGYFSSMCAFFEEVRSCIDYQVPEMEDMPDIERYDEALLERGPKEPKEKEPKFKDLTDPREQQRWVYNKIKERGNIPGAIKLEPLRDKNGLYRHKEGAPIYKDIDYNLVNMPRLGRKQLKYANPAVVGHNFNKVKDIYAPEQFKYLNPSERRKLSWLEKVSAVNTMAGMIQQSYHTEMTILPAVMAGSGWYTRMTEKIKKAFPEGNDAEIFCQLLGATSAKTPVENNFIQALDAFDQLKAGKFNRHVEIFLEAYEHLKKGTLKDHLKEVGLAPSGTVKTDAAALAKWIDHHGILPRQKNGQKYNANSVAVLKVLARKWIELAKSPKTPNFAGNLLGTTREATIDVWAARFVHALGHKDSKKPWLIQPGAETGVTPLDFAFSQRCFRVAADHIKDINGNSMQPDDLQAIAWYFQKHVWDREGWTRGAGKKKASFDETFDRVFTPDGKRRSDEEMLALFQAAAEERAREAAASGKSVADELEDEPGDETDE